jgi:hypothetical protein
MPLYPPAGAALPQSWLMEPMRKAPSGTAAGPGLPSCCGMPPWCLASGVPAFCACSVAVRASILRSSSATRLSAFFWRLRVGGVVMLCAVSGRVKEAGHMPRTRRGQLWRIACTRCRGGPGRNEPAGVNGRLRATVNSDAPSARDTSRMRAAA